MIMKITTTEQKHEYKKKQRKRNTLKNVRQRENGMGCDIVEVINMCVYVYLIAACVPCTVCRTFDQKANG